MIESSYSNVKKYKSKIEKDAVIALLKNIRVKLDKVLL